MTAKKNLAKSMLMSTLTAAIFTFVFILSLVVVISAINDSTDQEGTYYFIDDPLNADNQTPTRGPFLDNNGYFY